MESTVSRFRSALKVRLKSDLAALCEVHYGAQDPNKMGSKVLIIGRAKRVPLQFTCGMTAAHEEYDVELLASVLGPVQSTGEELSAVAYGIVDALVTSILAWDTLPTGVNIVVPTESEDDEAVGDGFRESTVKQTLRVTARI